MVDLVGAGSGCQVSLASGEVYPQSQLGGFRPGWDQSTEREQGRRVKKSKEQTLENNISILPLHIIGFVRFLGVSECSKRKKIPSTWYV